MKTSLFIGLSTLAGYAAAFYGQLSADAYDTGEGGEVFQNIYLLDENTHSEYYTILYGGFNACTGGTECSVYFEETTPGGYDFNAKLWRTADGCHNIDFEGGLGAGHGYCCGSLPCNLSA